MLNYLAEALGALAANRLRSSLALLGLIVGVAAVIAIQVLGHATAGAMAGIFQGFSSYTFVLYPNTQNGFDPKSSLTLAQIASLKNLPGVSDVIPYSQTSAVTYVGHNRAQLTIVGVGTSANYFAQPLAEGRTIDQADVDNLAPVCVISNAASKKLSPDGADILGSQIRAGGLRCRIVGVLQPSPAGAINYNFSPDVSIPSTTFIRQYFQGSDFYAIEVLVGNPDKIADVETAVTARVVAMHNGKFSYQIFDSRTIAGMFSRVFGVLTMIVGTIGAISLCVAGIGIANVLLVSITERTREIGVRKAIGARRGQVLLQFFLEAALLTFTGCFVGTLLGLAIGWWINRSYIVKISGVIVALPWEWSVLIALTFAIIISGACGLLPAYRAARLDPVEALRYE